MLNVPLTGYSTNTEDYVELSHIMLNTDICCHFSPANATAQSHPMGVTRG